MELLMDGTMELLIVGTIDGWKLHLVDLVDIALVQCISWPSVVTFRLINYLKSYYEKWKCMACRHSGVILTAIESCKLAMF